MLKRTLIFTLAIVVLVAIFIVSRPQHVAPLPGKFEFTATNQHRQPLSFARTSDGVVRTIYAIVEADGVYFGERRVDFDSALTYLDATAKNEGIRAVYVCITESARYGDAVRFYIGIDKSKYYVSSFPTFADPTGERLPVTGAFRVEADCWFDKVNGVELYAENAYLDVTPAPFDLRRSKPEPNKALVPTATSVTPAADAPVAPAAAAAHL
jgi:hypothetical protein